MQQQTYPVHFSVDYPDRQLDRLTTFFRVFIVLPIAIVLGVISGENWQWTVNGKTITIVIGTGGLLFFASILMILFRQKYPHWWFDWNLQLMRFSNRVLAYIALMNDRYPSTDEEQSVHLDFPYPDVPRELNRWLPLVKWFLAIPHYVVLFFLDIAAVVAVIIAWFSILFTGHYPKELFDFVVGVFRWHNRVIAYAFVLVTDQYPPFRLTDERYLVLSDAAA